MSWRMILTCKIPNILWSTVQLKEVCVNIMYMFNTYVRTLYINIHIYIGVDIYIDIIC